MKLTIIGSGSKGNGYLLDNGTEALLIEAGVPFKAVLHALCGHVERLAGCLISHEHGDHAGHVGEVLDYAVPTYATCGTIKAMGRGKRGFEPTALQGQPGTYRQITVGKFIVQPFETRHDAAEPAGFLIWHHETGTVLFATDTYYLPNRYAGLNNILIECNYDPTTLDRRIEAGEIPAALRRRLHESHLSFETCRQALLANELSEVCRIVLIHISEGNGDPGRFAAGIAAATGIETIAARAGLTIDFNKTPF